ncbi:MAG: transposase [Desulfosporosinus sp.]|nr:transposase [Desulfosporosinus sp.]MDA8224098.1 transposase [Desulfitobacterium hafniense]
MEDGREFIIDQVLEIRQAAAMKAGGQGDRYTVRVQGSDKYLFFLPKGGRKKLCVNGYNYHKRSWPFMQSDFKEALKELAKECHSVEDIQEKLRELFKETLQQVFESEMDEHLDMSVFPTDNNLSSWAGMSPGNNESAGKKKRSRATPGNKYLNSFYASVPGPQQELRILVSQLVTGGGLNVWAKIGRYSH